MLVKDIGVGHAEEPPGGGVTIELREDVVFRIPRAAEDLARVVRNTARRCPERLGHESFDEAGPFDRQGREVGRRQHLIERLDEVPPGSHIGNHHFDRAKLADRVAGFLVLKQTGKLHATGRMLDCPPAELIGHAQRNGGQVRGAEDTPGPQEPIAVHGCVRFGQRQPFQSNARETGPAQAERGQRLDFQIWLLSRLTWQYSETIPHENEE